jgi:hypothetical protein
MNTMQCLHFSQHNASTPLSPYMAFIPSCFSSFMCCFHYLHLTLDIIFHCLRSLPFVPVVRNFFDLRLRLQRLIQIASLALELMLETCIGFLCFVVLAMDRSPVQGVIPNA